MGMDIALIGNPDCGITTLFNQLTGGTLHEGHFSAAGRKTKEGPIKGSKDINLIQLPGTYSLSAYSADDLAIREILLQGKPDVLINVVDATAFERNLYLTLQLLELKIPMVLALNMMDEIKGNKIRIDLEQLSKELTIPVVPVAASKNCGIPALFDCAIKTAVKNAVAEEIDFCTGPAHTAIHAVNNLITENAERAGLPPAFCCTRIMEGDPMILEALQLESTVKAVIEPLISHMEHSLGTDRESAMADMRYDFIDRLCKKVIARTCPATKEHLRSVRADRLLTHRLFAIPIFLSIMLLIFYITFGSLGTWLSRWLSMGIDQCIQKISYGLLSAGVNPAFHALIIDGICAGIGSVLSFLPIIAVLFFFLSILEDSGYMPRVAFVMDKLLGKLGLSGRSIVPMLIGFGCSVPAIMATRSLPGKRDRHLTILLIPFMSCSAKLPVYAMFTAAFFTDNKALVMGGLYLIGIATAILCALAFKNTAFPGDPTPFILVLPPYRLPAMKSVALRMWENVKGFIKKAFTVIFVATVIIWFLQSFDTSFNLVSSSDNSILAVIGKKISPLFVPLGFGDWRSATALLAGMSAKEAVVSTLAVLTGTAEGASLPAMLSQMFTPCSAFAFLVFCLLYMPCVATLTAIGRELGGLRYALGVLVFQCSVAWIIAFIVFHVGSFFL